MGFKCPTCARHADDVTGRPSPRRGPAGGVIARARTGSGASLPAGNASVRGGAAGLGAAVLGGLVLAPVLTGGAFLLISAGVIGWAVARAVFWASEEVSTPLLKALALAFAGFSVAVGMGVAGTAPVGIPFLAYPAAVYGGWIVVRQR